MMNREEAVRNAELNILDCRLELIRQNVVVHGIEYVDVKEIVREIMDACLDRDLGNVLEHFYLLL